MQIHFLTDNTDVTGAVEEFLREWNAAPDFVTVNTSGSTGTPKTIRIQKKNMIASARMTGAYLNLSPGDNALLCLSANTIAGKMMIVRSIQLDLKLFVTDVSSTPVSALPEQIDFVAMVPIQFDNTLKTKPEFFTKGQKIIIGGGTISDQLRKKIPALPSSVYQTYGMTETISHVAMRNLSAKEINYTTLPGISFSTEDDCLVIHAPQLGIDSLKTTDCVELISPTSFHWLGRNDFVINSGGIKIHPEQIEEKLGALIQRPFFSTGLPDESLGTRHVICIEDSVSEKIDKQLLSSYLDKYHIPKEIYYINAFRYTESGKINKPETLKLLKDAEKQVL